MSDTYMSEDRLVRMEDKIDKLVEAVITMAHLHESVDRVEKRVDELEDDVHAIQVKMPMLDLVMKGLGRAGAVLITLVVTGAVGSYFVL